MGEREISTASRSIRPGDLGRLIVVVANVEPRNALEFRKGMSWPRDRAARHIRTVSGFGSDARHARP